MKKPLRINETEDTPSVVFDINANEFSISGRSFPEDSSEFYKPLIEWMQNYISEPNPNTILRISLDYLNSSSIKQILNLLMLLEKPVKMGKDIKVIWCYNADDDLIEVKGQELKSMLSVPFELMEC
jgi:hypothetical protein